MLRKFGKWVVVLMGVLFLVACATTNNDDDTADLGTLLAGVSGAYDCAGSEVRYCANGDEPLFRASPFTAFATSVDALGVACWKDPALTECTTLPQKQAKRRAWQRWCGWGEKK